MMMIGDDKMVEEVVDGIKIIDTTLVSFTMVLSEGKMLTHGDMTGQKRSDRPGPAITFTKYCISTSPEILNITVTSYQYTNSKVH